MIYLLYTLIVIFAIEIIFILLHYLINGLKISEKDKKEIENKNFMYE